MASKKLTDLSKKLSPENKGVIDLSNVNTGGGLIGVQNLIDGLDSSITADQQALAGLGQEQINMQNDFGIDKQLQQINEQQAKLRQFQDKQVEIPLQEKQAYRDASTLGTKTSLANATTQNIENATLGALAQSRQIEATSNTLNTNLALVQQKIEARQKQLEFNIEQKTKLYDKALKSYESIMTSKEKTRLEEMKFNNELKLYSAKSDSELRNKLILQAAENGIDVSNMDNASTQDILSTIARNSGGLSEGVYRFDLSPDEIARMDYKQQQSYYKALEARDNLNDKEQQKIQTQIALYENANRSIDTLGNILNNESGLSTAVGTVAGVTRATKNAPLRSKFDSNYTNFIADAKQMFSTGTLKTLEDLKARGGTLGAISEKELETLRSALGAFNAVKDEDGNIIGQFDMTEEKFKSSVKKILASQYRSKIISTQGMSADRYTELGVSDMSVDELKQLSNTLTEPTLDKPLNSNEFYQKLLQASEPTAPSQETISLIESEEGFRNNAYRDATGKWTIGFGTTEINGRPVRKGDTITREEAAREMQAQLATKYSNWKKYINVPLNSMQKAALYSFEYNLGGNIWLKSARKIADLINRNDMAGAADEMKKYNKARVNGKLQPLSALVKRRNREASYLLS